MKISCYIWYKTWKRKHSNRSKKLIYRYTMTKKYVQKLLSTHVFVAIGEYGSNFCAVVYNVIPRSAQSGIGSSFECKICL